MKPERELREHVILVKSKILNRRKKDEDKGATIDDDYFAKLIDRGSFHIDIINLIHLIELEDVTEEEVNRIWVIALAEHLSVYPPMKLSRVSN